MKLPPPPKKKLITMLLHEFVSAVLVLFRIQTLYDILYVCCCVLMK